MSKDTLFENGNQPGTKNPTPPEVDENQDYLEVLVGEGKKFDSVEELAKGKYQSDKFIEQLIKEQSELREELSKSKSIEEHLNDLRSAVVKHNKKEDNIREMTPSDPDLEPNTPADPSPNNAPSPDDIQKLVAAEVNRRVTEQQKDSNIRSVIDAAKAKHGDNYKKVLSDKASELGSSPDELFQIAEKNPKLFNRVMDLEGEPAKEEAPQNRVFESVNTDALRNQNNKGQAKRYSDFQDLRKSDPVKYFSAEVQNEMYRLAEEIGPDFFND